MIVQGHIDEQGNPLTYRREELLQWFKDHAGKKFRYELKVDRKKRSNPQNAWYWAEVVPTVRTAMNSYGNSFSLETTHEFLKKEFNYKEVEAKEGHFLKVPVSTTELDTLEFSSYIDRIIVFAAEMFGVRIRLPEEQLSLIDRPEYCPLHLASTYDHTQTK